MRKGTGTRSMGTRLLVAASLVLASLAGGCGGAAATTTGQPDKAGGTQEAKMRIGIIQIVEHPALDAARQGFMDVLKERGLDGRVSYDYQNAQGDMSTAQTIAQKFAADKVDLILAIATPTAQAAAKATQDIPVLITAVTDPVAAGLVKSLEQPGANVTGTTDMNPVAEQIALIKEVAPAARRVGILYNAGEVNSVVQVKLAREAAAKLGLDVVEATVANSGEVAQAAQSLVGRVDGIYVPTDNAVVSAAAAVIKVAQKAKLPIIAGERSVVDAGGTATVGIDYYKLGRQTGEMASRVLQGGKPASMPVESQQEFSVVVNQKSAEAIGLKLPEALLGRAEVLR